MSRRERVETPPHGPDSPARTERTPADGAAPASFSALFRAMLHEYRAMNAITGDLHRHWLFPAKYAGLAAFVVALAVAAGCLPASKPKGQPVCPAPVVAGNDAAAQEEAYWRNQYSRNRPVPPKEFQVPPKPPRNNRFGEFDDGLYHGLDRQPTLPALPGDSAAASAARGSGYPLPPSDLAQFGGAPAGGSTAPAVTETAMARTASSSSGTAARPGGIRSEQHFYPMEQLVYGGDYPDIDRPELYRLMPKDVITVTVRDHPEFSDQLEIQPDGTVKVPNAHDLVRLRGLTVEEAAEAFRQTLQPYVRGDCQVRVQANRARGGYYYIFGDVLQPGRFPMGLEPIRLSEAVLAANWEANPSRRDADGDELGPAFPAASPRGKYVAPASADMARIMLITPHRSQPVRTVHDVRSAMMGVTANDPAIRPGQIIVVPSLLPERNRALGIDLPGAGASAPVAAQGAMTGQGFSTGASPARLPDVAPEPTVRVPSADSWGVSMVEANMTGAYDDNRNSGGAAYVPTRVIGRVVEEPADLTLQRRAAPRRTSERGEPPIPGGTANGRGRAGPGGW